MTVQIERLNEFPLQWVQVQPKGATLRDHQQLEGYLQ
jgi:hypothetical protein